MITMANLVMICYHRKMLSVTCMLYFLYLWLIYFAAGNFVPHYLPSPASFPYPLLSGSCLLALCIYNSVSFLLSLLIFFLDSAYKWNHTVFVFIWLISLSITPFGSIHIVTYGKISFFLWLSNISSCIYVCVYMYMCIWASLVAQTVKNLPAMQETQIRSPGWEDPLEKGMAIHSSILAWRIPWTEEPGRLHGVTGSDTTERLSHICIYLMSFIH